MDQINVRLDLELKERIESAAKAEGVSPSEVARAGLRDHFDANPPPASCLDIALKLGLVGGLHRRPERPEHEQGLS